MTLALNMVSINGRADGGADAYYYLKDGELAYTVNDLDFDGTQLGQFDPTKIETVIENGKNNLDGDSRRNVIDFLEASLSNVLRDKLAQVENIINTNSLLAERLEVVDWNCVAPCKNKIQHPFRFIKNPAWDSPFLEGAEVAIHIGDSKKDDNIVDSLFAYFYDDLLIQIKSTENVYSPDGARSTHPQVLDMLKPFDDYFKTTHL